VLVSVWEGSEARPEVERFRELWGIDATILLDESGDYARRLGIRGVPTNVLVDAEGIVRDVGLVRLDDLHAAVDRLIAAD
jgi:hypothetical protein